MILKIITRGGANYLAHRQNLACYGPGSDSFIQCKKYKIKSLNKDFYFNDFFSKREAEPQPLGAGGNNVRFGLRGSALGYEGFSHGGWQRPG